MATTRSPSTVTSVDCPIGPRRNGNSTSLLLSASSPPPTRAMRNGNEATMVVAPIIAARMTIGLTPDLKRRAVASASGSRVLTGSRIARTNHHSPNAASAPA